VVRDHSDTKVREHSDTPQPEHMQAQWQIDGD
jgi:hypothetical protein